MEELANWWEAHPARGSASARLVSKLSGLCRHLIGRQRRIPEDRTRIRDEALNAIQELNVLEDTRPLSVDEHTTRKKLRDGVAEADLKTEMDWRQGSKQLWLVAGDANTGFFQQVTCGRRRLNRVHSIRVGDNTYRRHIAVRTAMANHFRSFYQKGLRNKWEWTGDGSASLSVGHQEQLIRPFTKEEVKAAIWGLNGEGALGPDGIPVCFNNSAGTWLSPR